MKVFKRILKCIAIIGSIVGFINLIIKVFSVKGKMQDYNQKAIGAGKELNYEEEPFVKDSVAGLFSGIQVDFAKATMKDLSSVLDIYGRFSGIQVTVPEHWHVKLDGVQKNSGVEQKFEDNSQNDEAPVLNINYDLKFSGLMVRNPKDEETCEDDEEIIEEEIIEEEILDEADDLEEDIEVVDFTDEKED